MPKISNLCVSYQDKVVFQGFDLEVPAHTTLCIMGQSGCGKSTLLNCVANLIPYKGKTEGFGACGYVFQESRLIPSMTVLDNVCYVLQGEKEDIKKRAQNALDNMHIGHLANKYPTRISGGEASRVSLARALAYGAQTLLLDEPFRALDIGIKRGIIHNMVGEGMFGATVLFVTHDVEEALMCADRIVVLGGSPCNITADISLPSPRDGRSVNDPELNRAREQIIQALSAETRNYLT